MKLSWNPKWRGKQRRSWPVPCAVPSLPSHATQRGRLFGEGEHDYRAIYIIQRRATGKTGERLANERGGGGAGQGVEGWEGEMASRCEEEFRATPLLFLDPEQPVMERVGSAEKKPQNRGEGFTL